MKIERKTLYNALKRVSVVVPSNPLLPILGNFLIEVSGGIMQITASDLYNEVSVRIPCEHDADHVFTVDAMFFKRVIEALKDYTVLISVDHEHLQIEITQGRSKFKSPTEAPADFPKTPKQSKSGSVVEYDALKEALLLALPFASRDELRPNLSCIYFDGIELCATDANRLTTVPFDSELKGVLLSVKGAQLLCNVFDGGNIKVGVSTDGNMLKASSESIEIYTRLVDQRYPNYKSVIPQGQPIKAIFDSLDMQDAISKALLTSNNITKQVRLNFDGGLCFVSSEDIDYAKESRHEIACDLSGAESFEIGFGGNLLIELLKTKQGEVCFELSSPDRAVVFRNSLDGVSLLMPMMLNSHL